MNKKMAEENACAVLSEVICPNLNIPNKYTTFDAYCNSTDSIYSDFTYWSTQGCQEVLSEITVEPCCLQNESKIAQLTLDTSFGVNTNEVLALEEMPVIVQEACAIPTYNHSNVWIDPSRSQFVYNQCVCAPEPCHYQITESTSLEDPIEHCSYTYVFEESYETLETETNIELAPSPGVFNEYDNLIDINVCNDEFEGGILLNIPEEVVIAEESKQEIRELQEFQEFSIPNVEYENSALKELMSRQSVSKVRKTILYIGRDAKCGETIQNISYSGSKRKCIRIEEDHEKEPETVPAYLKKKKYECDHCKQLFPRMSSFRGHLDPGQAKKKPSNQRYICSQCGKGLKSLEKLNAHYKGHGDPDLECPKCFNVYASKASLKVHMKIHDRKYPCPNCRMSYAVHKDFIAHLLRKHHIFRCNNEDCSYETDSSSQLDLHNIEHEILESSDVVEDVKDEVKVERKAKSRAVKSALITYEESSFDSNKTDVDGDSGYDSFMTSPGTVEVDREILQRDNIFDVFSNVIFSDNPKKMRKTKKYWECSHCSKTFLRHNDLKRHIIEHAIRLTLAHTPVSKKGTMTFLCGVCKKETFTQLDKYKAHLRAHAKMTVYQCTFCDKSFSDSSNFSKHKKTHGDAYYQCDMCKRKFHSKVMLTKHMEYHMKNKPLKCQQCSKTFHFPSTLNKHMKMYHKVVNPKFKCRFCETAFCTVKEKWVHEWESHGFRKEINDCAECGTQFRKYSELKKHCCVVHGVDIPKAKKVAQKGKQKYGKRY